MAAALTITRTGHTAAELRAVAGKSCDAAQARRLLGPASILDGRPRTEAAKQNGMDRQTLRDRVHRCNASGINGSTSRASPGRTPALSEVQRAELKARVVAGPDPVRNKAVRWRCADLREAVAHPHAALVCDGAGWHQTGGRLCVPDNVTLIPLPPYSPELNSMENVWQYLRADKLCALVWDSYEAILDACETAWSFLINDPERIRTSRIPSSPTTVG